MPASYRLKTIFACALVAGLATTAVGEERWRDHKLFPFSVRKSAESSEQDSSWLPRFDLTRNPAKPVTDSIGKLLGLDAAHVPTGVEQDDACTDAVEKPATRDSPSRVETAQTKGTKIELAKLGQCLAGAGASRRGRLGRLAPHAPRLII